MGNGKALSEDAADTWVASIQRIVDRSSALRSAGGALANHHIVDSFWRQGLSVLSAGGAARDVRHAKLCA